MIGTQNAIIIFTKDRPDVLDSTLLALKQVFCPIIVLDDSSKILNRKENLNRTYAFSNVYYHGRNDQKKLIKKYYLESDNLNYFINKLGVKKWNLGYVRNYALILSKVYGFKKVLFMDDDITIPNAKLIIDIFEKLDQYNFVGSKVTGMLDDSVTGHIVRKLGLEPEEYFSGGFIAFCATDICEYFINQYNEDWIWMYLHNFNLKFHLFGEVLQQPFDPFKNGKNKATSQEIGELLVDGVKEAHEAKKISLLTDLKFWKRMMKEKNQYYKMLSMKCQEEQLLELETIIKNLIKHLKTIKPNMLLRTFNDYFKQREIWGSILSKVNSQLM